MNEYHEDIRRQLESQMKLKPILVDMAAVLCRYYAMCNPPVKWFHTLCKRSKINNGWVNTHRKYRLKVWDEEDKKIIRELIQRLKELNLGWETSYYKDKVVASLGELVEWTYRSYDFDANFKTSLYDLPGFFARTRATCFIHLLLFLPPLPALP